MKVELYFTNCMEVHLFTLTNRVKVVLFCTFIHVLGVIVKEYLIIFL
jgi:hypothetical protein